ncbi:MAG: hypothetical protein GXP17_09890 [Gammaproteobacteria bacterium]|nr:hypothetical protein [Gammaproteobacteria bacterium]
MKTKSDFSVCLICGSSEVDKAADTYDTGILPEVCYFNKQPGDLLNQQID